MIIAMSEEIERHKLSSRGRGRPGGLATLRCTIGIGQMTKTTEKANKVLVLEAFDTLFNKRDYKAAERYWSSNYIQHSAHIPPGRDGLFNLIRNAPATLKYEPGLIVAEGEYVIAHGRFSNTGKPRNWIAADVVRVADDVLAEHWDVLQDEATEAEFAKRSAYVREHVSRVREASVDHEESVCALE